MLIRMRRTVFAAAMALTASAASAQAARPAETPATLAAAGEDALEAKRYGDALAAFARAATMDPRDPQLRVGAGIAAAMLGQLPLARTWLEGALAMQPRLTGASLLLGQVLYRQGKVPEALAALEAALRYAPADATLLAARDQWQKESRLNSRFYETRGAHFTVMFEGPADDIAGRRVVELLEQAYLNVGRRLSTYPDEPVTVVLYTRQQFHDITRSPQWADGAYDGRIKIPMAGALDRSEDLRRILGHEYVHAIVAGLAGSTVPVWLNEGLASALEPGDLSWARQALAADGHRLRFADLERGFGRLSQSQAAVAYAQSALGVKKLIELRGEAALVTLLQGLGRGEPFESAFHRAILMRLDEFQAIMLRE
jgi:tetratricopeptide (TPR) repeat protein